MHKALYHNNSPGQKALPAFCPPTYRLRGRARDCRSKFTSRIYTRYRENFTETIRIRPRHDEAFRMVTNSFVTCGENPPEIDDF